MDKNKLNPHFLTFDTDYLYHLGLDTQMDLASVFGEVKYVIFTLSNLEASVIANEFAKNIYHIQGENFSYLPIYKTERFHMYKVGSCIVTSIGVGMPSLLICINEITKLLAHLNKHDVVFLKIGFCGGLGVKVGDIVISNQIVNGKFEGVFESIECGKTHLHPTTFEPAIARQIFDFSHAVGFESVSLGINLSTHDFNDEQARLNGALPPSYTKPEAAKYLKNAYEFGIRSIDMESLAFAGFCHQLQIPGCVIGVSVIDRLDTEDININMDTQLESLNRFAKILISYIKTKDKI